MVLGRLSVIDLPTPNWRLIMWRQDAIARKTYATEQMIGMLREVEARLGQGAKAGGICRSLSIPAMAMG
jgi:hypothetical protein